LKERRFAGRGVHDQKGIHNWNGCITKCGGGGGFTPCNRPFLRPSACHPPENVSSAPSSPRPSPLDPFSMILWGCMRGEGDMKEFCFATKYQKRRTFYSEFLLVIMIMTAVQVRKNGLIYRDAASGIFQCMLSFAPSEVGATKTELTTRKMRYKINASNFPQSEQRNRAPR